MNTAPVDSHSTDPLFQAREDARRRRAAEAAPPEVRRRLRAAASAPRATPVEIAFLADYGVPVEALRYAATLAVRQGVSADAVLLAEGIVAEEVFYRALAKDLGVDFLDGAFDVAPGALATARLGYVRLREAARVRWLFAPVGAQIFRLMSVARAAKGRPLFAVTTRSRFIEALRRASSEDVVRAARLSTERVDQDLCVRASLGRRPLALATFALALIVASLFSPLEPASLTMACLLAGAFLASVILRLAACAASFEPEAGVDRIDDARLPVYTVIVALYKEAAVARQLARALDRFDYPVLGSKHT
jgi:glycosyltransferase XagB